MTTQSILGIVFVVFAIYALVGFYIWYSKVVPYWDEHKHNNPAKFWSLESTRGLRRKVFLEGHSMDADKTWIYYFVKYHYVPVIAIVLAVFISEITN